MDAMPDPPPPVLHQPRSGLHLAEWSCELLGTALLLLGGLSAVCFNIGPHSPLRDLPDSPRLLLTGLLFAGTGSLLAVSPIGRRSGAHLNPVVTLAFWTQRHVHPHDLLGYVVTQLLGGCSARPPFSRCGERKPGQSVSAPPRRVSASVGSPPP